MVDRFVDRLVRVPMFGVFADHGDADFVFGIAQAMHDIVPGLEIRFASVEPEPLDEELIDLVVGSENGTS